jgi:DnaJ-class molecular chaperone
MPGTGYRGEGTPDLYLILGVPKNASKEIIRNTYRKLARELHPDATGGDKAKEARFAEVTAAYAILYDDEERKKYDEETAHSPIRDRGTIFGKMFDDLVGKVSHEGIHGGNIDEVVAQFFGAVKDIQTNFPGKVQEVAKKPSSFLEFLEIILDEDVGIQPPTKK